MKRDTQTHTSSSLSDILIISAWRVLKLKSLMFSAPQSRIDLFFFFVRNLSSVYNSSSFFLINSCILVLSCLYKHHYIFFLSYTWWMTKTSFQVKTVILCEYYESITDGLTVSYTNKMIVLARASQEVFVIHTACIKLTGDFSSVSSIDGQHSCW